MTSVLLGAGYEIGDKIGHTMAYVLLVLAILIFVWVMFKYLNTDELNG